MKLRHPLGPGEHRISQRFSERPEYYLPLGYAGHEGLDFACETGTPVYAAHDGKILHLPYAIGYGRYCRIEGAEADTTYAHLSSYSAGDGAMVSAGQQIAISGETGTLDGPHLHWGVRKKPVAWANGYQGYVDPEPYLEEVTVGDPKWGMHIQGYRGKNEDGSPGWMTTIASPWGKVMDYASADDPLPLVRNKVARFYEEWSEPLIARGRDGGREFVRRMLSRWLPCRSWAKWFELPNEPGCNTNADLAHLNEFTIGAIEEAELYSLKLVVGNLPEGNPGANPGETDEQARAAERWKIQQLAPCIKRAAQGGHMLGLHAYCRPGVEGPLGRWHALGRVIWNVEQLFAAGVPTTLKVFVSEALLDGGIAGHQAHQGWQHFVETGEITEDQYIAWIVEFEGGCRALPWLAGWALFNCGSYSPWETYDHDERVYHKISAAMGVEPPADEPVGTVPTSLVNPSFEGEWYRPINEFQIPKGWTAWYHETDDHYKDGDASLGPYYNFRPEFKAADGQEFPTRAHAGRYASQWFKIYAHHDAGLYQKAELHGKYTFSAWLSAWCSAADNPDHSWDKAVEAPDGEMLKAPDAKPSKFFGKVGIDPTGGTDPLAASIVWGEPVTQCDVWTKAQAQTACDGVVTLFISAQPEWPLKHTDCYADDCSLEKAAPPLPMMEYGQQFVIPRNPDAALFKEALAHNAGAQPGCDEFVYEGRVCQMFRFPNDNLRQHWFSCPLGQYDQIAYQVRNE